MNRLAKITLASAILLVSFGMNAQSLKGPAYKNGSISEKYQGNSKVAVRVDPTAVKGPEAKNHRHIKSQSEKVILTASLKDTNYVADPKHYKVVDLKAKETKHSKGLKGPKFKNYRGK